ncbi:hypothetical protein DFP72DRAFT_812127 [Ephemerocybe angulata]|uniref:PH domain-containing protein n=1 Tax=Ephemerocybe angulata TaxID=980116 RepID=A0A8H6M424_9AGAR|nr:hypothetical protein DFP72DRAFT_812127 [Tulosesus angulatus]
MNVVLTKKVRKGRVGAGLPFEPWDNPTAELPPRVLQDIHASSTASLPAGTQPLLPSQIVGIATGAAAASNGNSNSHNYGGGDNLNAFSGPSNIHYSTPSTLSTTTLRPSMLVAESSHAALQDYEGDDEDSDTIHAGTTAATTTTTTTAMSSTLPDFEDMDEDYLSTSSSASAFSFSPPTPSSRSVSERDLLSTSVSSTSSSSEEVSAISSSTWPWCRGAVGCDDAWKGESERARKREERERGEREERESVTTMTTRSSSEDSEFVRSPPDSVYNSSSALLGYVSSPVGNENERVGLVESWRDQFGFGGGGGSFLSDLELSEPFLDPRRGGVFDEELDYPNGTNASIDASWNYGDNTTNDANWDYDGGDEDTNNNNLHLSFDALKSAMEGAGVWPSSADTVRPAASPDSRGGFADEGELGGDGLGGDEPAIGAGDDSERVGAADVVGKVVEEGGAVEETEGWGADLEKGWTEGGDGDGVGSPSEADLDLELEMLRYQPPRVSAVSMRGESSVVDGGGREASGTSGSGSGGYRARSQSHSTQEFGGYGAGGGGRWNTGGYGRGRGGGGEEDGDGDEERRRRGLQRGPEAYTGVGARQRRRGESEDEEDDERVDAERYGFAPPPNVRARTVPQSPNVRASASSAARFPCSSSGEDDDDVPLAQRIPGALTAQKSIRRQVREERQVKRLERAATGAARGGRGEGQYHPGQVEGGGFTRDRHATLRPAGAGGPSVPLSGTFSSSQEAAMYAAAPAGVERRATTTTRKRTNTMPSKAQNPFSAEDLAMRLQIAAAEQQGLASAPVASGHQHFGGGQFGVLPSRGASTRTSFEAGAPATGLARGRTMKEQGSGQHYTLANPPASASATTTAKAGALRLMRSFTRDKSRAPVEEAPPAYQPLPSEAEYRSALQRHVSRSQSRVRERGEDLGMQRKRSVSVSRAPGSPHAHGVEGGVPPVPPLPSGSVMDDQQQGQGHAPRKLWKVGRASHEGERPGTGAGRSPVVQVAPLPVHAGPVVQQRFFVGDMQRFHMVEITGATTAGEVVDVIEAQGGFKGLEGAGGWMVYEVAQDFGMERPIRSFELLADVQASWNKDKMVNLFVLKNTPLALPLSRNAIPASSPTYSGYIEWEVKRGKWSKRWLQLREHSLWLSKREGKEEVLLCSLSNFDAYFISRAHRAPKPFAFAVKSTDSLTFFENAADYVHNFSCNESNGRVWMEKILIARSYVLQQERQILFNPKAVGGNASGGLSRAPTTRKSTSQRPAAPLVSVPPLVFSNQAPPQRDKVFEPGSLLHGQL